MRKKTKLLNSLTMPISPTASREYLSHLAKQEAERAEFWQGTEWESGHRTTARNLYLSAASAMPEKISAKRKKPKKQIATVNPLSVRVGDNILCVMGEGTTIGKVISAVNLPIGNNAKNRRFRWRFSLEFNGTLGTFRQIVPHTLFIRKCNSNDIKDL